MGNLEKKDDGRSRKRREGDKNVSKGGDGPICAFTRVPVRCSVSRRVNHLSLQLQCKFGFFIPTHAYGCREVNNSKLSLRLRVRPRGRVRITTTDTEDPGMKQDEEDEARGHVRAPSPQGLPQSPHGDPNPHHIRGEHRR
jgi:hypothetical protein